MASTRLLETVIGGNTVVTTAIRGESIGELPFQRPLATRSSGYRPTIGSRVRRDAVTRPHRPVLGQRSRSRFFASRKGELIGLQTWPTRATARRAVVEYIGWHNGTRLHSTLGYRSPDKYQEQNKITNVA